MRVASSPWQHHRPAEFRLSGFGGAAVFLRTCALPGSVLGEADPLIAVDIELVSPESRWAALARPMIPTLADGLSQFLLSAAQEFYPEESVPAFQDQLAGVLVSVESSAPDRVCLEWTVVKDMAADVLDFETLNFETSRAALVTASHEVRFLTDFEAVPMWEDD